LREFFTLLMLEVVTKSGLCEGPIGSASLSHDARAIQNRTYYVAGKMIATSICHGGPAPHSFSFALAEMIVYGKVMSPVSIEDIPDEAVKEALCKVHLKYIHTIFCLTNNN